MPGILPLLAPHRLFIIVLSMVAFCPAAWSQEKPKLDISKEEQTQIAAAKTPDELLVLAKGFLAAKQHAAASVCIERACALNPKLAADLTPQTPDEWNRFWFTERASLAERKLSKTDAAGRVKIALWLKEAGLAVPAGDMLAAALTIDKNLPEANELAKKWNLSGNEPMRLELGVRLTEPMLLDSFKDENQDVILRKGRIFLLVPARYNPGNNKLMINKTFLKVTSEDGKLCTVKGIVLLKSAGSTSGTGAGAIELSIQDQGEPLWERVQVERKTDQNEFELSCVNSVPPITRGPKERGAAAPRPEGAVGKQARMGSGFMAFLTEVPEEMISVTVEYKGLTPIQLKADFLKALACPVDKTGEVVRTAISTLIAESASAEGIIASAAVKKLGQFRKSVSEAAAGTETKKPKAGADNIERAMLSAVAHADPVTQRAGFEALILEPATLNASTLDLVQKFPDAAIVLALLEQLASVLSAVEEEETAALPVPTGDPNDAVGRAVASLKPSKVSPNVFAVLAVSLKHADAKVRERTLELLLNDGTRESVMVLAKSTGAARDILVSKLGTVSDQKVKAAVLRCLLIRADAAAVAKLMASAGTVEVIIENDDDPLITALGGQASPDSARRLLEMVAQADLSAVANSEAFKKSLTNLATVQQNDAGVRGVLLKLAVKNVQMPYEAPVKRERNTGGAPASGSAFETVLAILAAGADVETSRAAAEALIRAGRLSALNERFKLVQNARRKDVISRLYDNKSLWEGEALPMFLVSRFSDTEPKAAQPALAALALMQKGIDPKQRWRLNLAIKQELDLRRLIELSVDTDELIAQPATELLLGLARLSAADEAEVRSTVEMSTREQKMNAVEQARTSAPTAGMYGAMLYLDVERSGAAGEGGDPQVIAALPSSQTNRQSIPLVSKVVSVQVVGQRLTLTADGQELRAGSNEQPEQAVPLQINLAPLLQAAFESPEAEKDSLNQQVDLSVLNQELACQLKYERLGSWGCELSIPESPSGESERPLRLTGAKLVLEPLPVGSK